MIYAVTSQGNHMAKRKHRPTDPAEAARKRYEAKRKGPAGWGVNEAALTLESQADVSDIEASRTTVRSLRRFSCFDTLQIPAEDLKAVSRLEDLIAIRFHVDGEARPQAGINAAGSAELGEFRAIEAGREIDAVLKDMKPWQANLLLKLLGPPIVEGKRINWHAVTKALTNLSDRDMQARAVKSAAESLRLAWIDLDNGVRVAA